MDGARRKGRTTAVNQGVDRVLADLADLADLQSIVVLRRTGIDCPWQPSATCSTTNC